MDSAVVVGVEPILDFAFKGEEPGGVPDEDLAAPLATSDGAVAAGWLEKHGSGLNGSGVRMRKGKTKRRYFVFDPKAAPGVIRFYENLPEKCKYKVCS